MIETTKSDVKLGYLGLKHSMVLFFLSICLFVIGYVCLINVYVAIRVDV